jgi:hypothetical protein
LRNIFWLGPLKATPGGLAAAYILDIEIGFYKWYDIKNEMEERRYAV